MRSCRNVSNDLPGAAAISTPSTSFDGRTEDRVAEDSRRAVRRYA